MNENRVKRILREGGLALGTHVGGIPDPQIVEIIGLAGFDAAFIDMEHTSFDLHDVQAMVMAAERVGITPLVRTPGFDPAFILRLLDMGVQGIQVPHVADAATARAAVAAVRYPPQGERGMAAGSRAAEFGRIPLTEHMAQSNREILLACMIEDMAAVECIDEIAAVEGVDLWRWARPICRAHWGSVGRRPPAAGGGDRPVPRGGEKERRRPARPAAEPCRLPAQRRAIEGARRRLYQLRPHPGGAPVEILARAGIGGTQAARVARRISAQAPSPRRHARPCAGPPRKQVVGGRGEPGHYG